MLGSVQYLRVSSTNLRIVIDFSLSVHDAGKQLGVQRGIAAVNNNITKATLSFKLCKKEKEQHLVCAR